jgi:hypothetical protein
MLPKTGGNPRLELGIPCTPLTQALMGIIKIAKPLDCGVSTVQRVLADGVRRSPTSRASRSAIPLLG